MSESHYVLHSDLTVVRKIFKKCISFVTPRSGKAVQKLEARTKRAFGLTLIVMRDEQGLPSPFNFCIRICLQVL